MEINRQKLNIIVLNWNGGNYILKCLKSLKNAKSNLVRINIIVVDNNSNDDSVRRIAKEFPKITILKNKKNLGYSGGNNIGIKYSLKNNADFIMLLNPDTTVNNNFIDPMIKLLASDKNVGIVGSKTYKGSFPSKIISNAGNFFDKNFVGKDLGNGKIDKGQYNSVLKTDYVSGTGILIKDKVFKEVGYFDERFFLYYEDADFCFRARTNGFICCFAQSSIIYHKGSVSTVFGSPLHTYYNARNRLLFLEKYSSFKVKFFEFKKVLKISLRYLVKKRNSDKYILLGLRDYLFRHFGERTYW
ncbi:MAG TPA: glycosyltransferase family 2 protein [Candidatus Sulfotelmatobacter sp.]|nr:glycosyltransferase family 2 protein [Candidatus Sulfotelmatobacter sp.]